MRHDAVRRLEVFVLPQRRRRRPWPQAPTGSAVQCCRAIAVDRIRTSRSSAVKQESRMSADAAALQHEDRVPSAVSVTRSAPTSPIAGGLLPQGRRGSGSVARRHGAKVARPQRRRTLSRAVARSSGTARFAQQHIGKKRRDIALSRGSPAAKKACTRARQYEAADRPAPQTIARRVRSMSSAAPVQDAVSTRTPRRLRKARADALSGKQDQTHQRHHPGPLRQQRHVRLVHSRGTARAPPSPQAAQCAAPQRLCPQRRHRPRHLGQARRGRGHRRAGTGAARRRWPARAVQNRHEETEQQTPAPACSGVLAR